MRNVSYLVANVFAQPCIRKTKDGKIMRRKLLCQGPIIVCTAESAVVPIRKFAQNQWRYCDVTVYCSVVHVCLFFNILKYISFLGQL